LASALGVKADVLYGDRVKSKFHHSKLHRYIFIKKDRKSIIKRIFSWDQK
jgi:hypothetical protein